MYTNEEIVEKIRELAKRKNTSLTDIEKNLAWSNGLLKLLHNFGVLQFFLFRPLYSTS